jgi:predicted nucleotidyltransferase
MQEELATLVQRRVDLLTRGFLSPLIRDRVEGEAVILYDAR